MRASKFATNIIKQKLGKAKKDSHCKGKKIAQRPNAVGRILSLFPEDEIHRNYRYSAYITNQEQSATDVWRTY